jgi:hypothetical protein
VTQQHLPQPHHQTEHRESGDGDQQQGSKHARNMVAALAGRGRIAAEARAALPASIERRVERKVSVMGGPSTRNGRMLKIEA